jgi:hypothetical protein
LRILGLPIEPPQAAVNRMLSDIAAVARLARQAPAQFDRIIQLGEEMVAIGHSVQEIAERLDGRAAAMMTLGERLDARATELVELGAEIRAAGDRIDSRGAEIVDAASRVVETGNDLVTVLPTFERALEMATPLEGAIDRFGRLVDRLPGGGTQRRRPDTRGGAPDPGSPESPEDLEDELT